jgi:hypothetical protein
MLEAGVNAVAVTALICSLATVGLLHFPAEIAAPGWMFVAASPFIPMSCRLCASSFFSWKDFREREQSISLRRIFY